MLIMSIILNVLDFCLYIKNIHFCIVLFHFVKYVRVMFFLLCYICFNILQFSSKIAVEAKRFFEISV